MKLSKIRLTPLAIAELVLIAILLPNALYLWSSGWRDMKYYRAFQSALHCYSVPVAVEVSSALQRAERVKKTSSLYLFKANFLAEQGKIEEAKGIYEELRESGWDDPLGKVGLLVCKLYQIAHKADNIADLIKLEKEAQELTKENPDLSDGYVLLGHVYLQELATLRTAGKHDKLPTVLDMAWKAFANAQTPKDASTWQPPSRHALLSMYMGKAIVSYEKGLQKINSLALPILPSPITQEITQDFYEATQALRGALALRTPHPMLIANLHAIYGQMLAFSWLESEAQVANDPNAKKNKQKLTRQYLIYEVFGKNDGSRVIQEGYLRELEKHKGIIGQERDETLLTRWQLRSQEYEELLGPLRYGLGVSYLFLGEFDSAEGFFSQTRAPQTAPVQNGIFQAQLGRTALKYEAFKKGKTTVFSAMAAPMVDYYKNSYDKVLQKKGPAKWSDFITVNNQLLCLYWQQAKPERIAEAAQILQRLAGQFSSYKQWVGVKQDPVTATQIAHHNLYMVYRSMELPYKEKAKPFATSFLERQ